MSYIGILSVGGIFLCIGLIFYKKSKEIEEIGERNSVIEVLFGISLAIGLVLIGCGFISVVNESSKDADCKKLPYLTQCSELKINKF